MVVCSWFHKNKFIFILSFFFSLSFYADINCLDCSKLCAVKSHMKTMGSRIGRLAEIDPDQADSIECFVHNISSKIKSFQLRNILRNPSESLSSVGAQIVDVFDLKNILVSPAFWEGFIINLFLSSLKANLVANQLYAIRSLFPLLVRTAGIVDSKDYVHSAAKQSVKILLKDFSQNLKCRSTNYLVGSILGVAFKKVCLSLPKMCIFAGKKTASGCKAIVGQCIPSVLSKKEKRFLKAEER